jgi:hypothetical protein
VLTLLTTPSDLGSWNDCCEHSETKSRKATASLSRQAPSDQSCFATHRKALSGMSAQYILAGIAAAGLAFWYDFKSWQSFGSQAFVYS